MNERVYREGIYACVCVCVCVCVRVSATVYLCASVGGRIKSSSRESAAKIIKMTQCITDGRPGAEYHTHTHTRGMQ